MVYTGLRKDYFVESIEDDSCEGIIIMQTTISVKKNYLYSVAYQLLLIIAPLVTSPLLSRRLGPDMIGQQSYSYSVATYFMLFTMLGVSNYGNRCVAKARDNRFQLSKTFWTIYGFQLIRALVVLSIYIIYVLFVNKKYYLIAIINSIYVLSGVFDISWMFFGMEQFKITVPVNFTIKVLNILAIVLLIKEPSDIYIYSIIIGMIPVITNVILWRYLKQFVDWYKPNFQDIKPHIKPELVLFLPVIAVSLYKVMDRIMLGNLSNSIEVGYYTQSESIVNIPMSLITSLGAVMLPRISNLISKGDVNSTKKYIESSILFAMMLASVMTFGLLSIAPTFATTFFGEKYAPCGILIMGLSVTIIFISWANVIRTQFLIPNSKDKEFMISIIAGAVVNLIINFCLIPKYASNGALIGTICAEFIVCVLQTFMVRKYLPIKKYFISVFPYICFGFIMFICVRFITPFFVNKYIQLCMQLLVGATIYGGILLIFSFFHKDFVCTTIQNLCKRIISIGGQK